MRCHCRAGLLGGPSRARHTVRVISCHDHRLFGLPVLPLAYGICIQVLQLMELVEIRISETHKHRLQRDVPR